MAAVTEDMVEAALRANANVKLFGQGSPQDWVTAALAAAARVAGLDCDPDARMVRVGIEASDAAKDAGSGGVHEWCRAALAAAFHDIPSVGSK